jgi:hypothetical protein
MKIAGHLTLLAQGVTVWAAFWVAGLPDYYQQYSPTALAVLCILLSVAVSLLAVRLLSRARPETRLQRAFWISTYFTVPLFVLDALYCGYFLGHGVGFLWHYWYLTVFYFTPWLTFIPTALLLRAAR